MLTSPRVSAIFGLNGEVEDLTSMASDISTQVGTWKIIAIPGGRDQGPGHYQWKKTRELALKCTTLPGTMGGADLKVEAVEFNAAFKFANLCLPI